MDDQLDQLNAERPSRKKYVWTYAIISAMIFIIVLLITHMFRDQLMDKNFIITGLYFVILLMIIIFAQLQIRSKVYNGAMGFSQAFGSGMLISVFSAFMYATFAFIFYQFIAPEVLDEMLVYAEQKMREDGATDEVIAMTMKWTKWFMSPAGILISTIFGHVLMGTIASLIASLFTQRQR